MLPVMTNQAGYAAHRGVSRKTVTCWKQRGLLAFSPDGEVDVQATDRHLADHGILLPGVTESTAPADTPGPGVHWSKAEAERVKENYAARLKQLEYERSAACVVEVDDVVMAVTSEYALVRKRVRAIGDRVAPHLANLTSAEEIKAAVDAEVVAALTELSIG